MFSYFLFISFSWSRVGGSRRGGGGGGREVGNILAFHLKGCGFVVCLPNRPGQNATLGNVLVLAPQGVLYLGLNSRGNAYHSFATGTCT